MKPPRRPPDEPELDQLLASRFKDTSPAFEARWRELRRELRKAPPPATWWGAWRVLPWLGVAAGLAAAWALLLHRPAAPAAGEGLPPELAELFEWDASLAAAVPLLDAENRDALLNLPVESNHGGIQP